MGIIIIQILKKSNCIFFFVFLNIKTKCLLENGIKIKAISRSLRYDSAGNVVIRDQSILTKNAIHLPKNEIQFQITSVVMPAEYEIFCFVRNLNHTFIF